MYSTFERAFLRHSMTSPLSSLDHGLGTINPVQAARPLLEDLCDLDIQDTI